jgi:hypothetical protein
LLFVAGPSQLLPAQFHDAVDTVEKKTYLEFMILIINLQHFLDVSGYAQNKGTII